MLRWHQDTPTLTMSILKANPVNPQLTDRLTFRPALPPAGFGLGITTYHGAGTPLPSFQGDPLLLPLGRSGPRCVADVLGRIE